MLRKNKIKVPYIYIIVSLAILSMSNVFMLLYEVDHGSYLRVREIVLILFRDVFFLYMPFLFINSKRMWLLFFPVILISFICFADILYFRNMGYVIPGTSFLLLFNLNQFVFDTAFSSIEFIDFIFLLPIIALTVFLYLKRRLIIVPIKFQQKLDYILICIICQCIFSISVMNRFGYMYLCKNKLEEFQCYVSKFLSSRNENHNLYFREYGFLGSIIIRLNEAFNNEEYFSENELNKIDVFFKKLNQKRNVIEDFKENVNKNLILIMVESWNTSTLNIADSLNILPNIKSLLKENNIIFVPNIKARVFHGRSSDAQFMYNTGLLPLKFEPFVCRFSRSDYPSLSKALGYNATAEFICEDKDIWEHGDTSMSFGFDSLFSNCGNLDLIEDEGVFRKALSEIKKQKDPFFYLITTLTMHDSYESKYLNCKDQNTNINLNKIYGDERDQEYLIRVSIFDKALGKFIDGLKKSGKYDKSVIVIVGDHEARMNCLSAALNEPLIPMIILNSGKSLNYNDTIEQIDVFPTILDVMGVKDYVPRKLNTPYRGVGKSIFSNQEDIDYKEAYEISDLLIRSRYFSGKHN